MQKTRQTEIIVSCNKKTIRGPEKTGDPCLILNEIAILMRSEKNCDFKNWTLPKTLVVSLLK